MNRYDLSRFDPLHGGCYPGGKSGSGVAQRIINLMPAHQVYIEPFLGGGAVMRYKRPAGVNIGIDRDPDVIERWLAAAPQFSQASADAAERRDSRRRPSRSLAPLKRAALPGAPLKHATQASAAEARVTRSRISSSAAEPRDAARLRDPGPAAEFPGEVLRWQFACGDGIQFLRTYPWTGRELVYCDPPYLHETRRDLKLYSYEMTKGQHAALLLVLLKLPCPVMLSGYRSDMYYHALRTWHSVDYRTMTRRGVATETLWSNFAPPLELHDYRYLGKDRRERERIKRMQATWTRRLAKLGALERQALLSVLNASADRAGAPAPSVLPSNPSCSPALP